MSENIQLPTSKGGCLTPTILIAIILALMVWKIARGETDGIRFGCNREEPAHTSP